MVALQAALMPNILTSRYQRIPPPQGETAAQASEVYTGVYGELPMPATAFALSDTPLRSLDVQPSVKTVASNASVVDRHNMKQGMISVGGRQSYVGITPEIYDNVDSSKFQPWLIGPIVNYSMNDRWYIAYPAATVMNGGKHNMAWSERVPQLPTRTSGGPGPATMLPAPRFKSVQTVPRYSTMPPRYNTQSTQG